MIPAAVLATACGGEAPPVSTASLGAQFEVASWDGYTSEARAVLRDRDHVPVALPTTDEVQVTNQDWQVELIPRTDDGAWYHAVVPSAPAGSWHNFAILREGRPSAGYNEVLLPLDPQPVVPAAWSRSEELVVAWAADAAATEPLRVAVVGPCLDARVVEARDADGTYAFAPGEITGSGSCEATVTLSRVARSQVDDALRGGSVEAWQHRAVPLTSDP